MMADGLRNITSTYLRDEKGDIRVNKEEEEDPGLRHDAVVVAFLE